MKKIFLFIITAFILIPLTDVYASGSINVSNGSLTVTKGQSVSFTVSAINAAGNVLIQSSNSGIASVDVSSYFFDTSLGSSSVTVTVTGVNAGTTQINVILDDVGTFDNEELTGTRVVNVRVEEPAPPQQEEPKQNNNSNNSNNYSNNSSSTNNTQNRQEEKKDEEKKEEEVKEKEPLKITKFDIVGYDLLFDINKTNYDIDILDGLNELYIIVEGEGIEATNTGRVSILGLSEIDIEVKNKDISNTYKIKLNRIRKNDLVNKKTTTSSDRTNKILLSTTILLSISTLSLGVLLIYNKTVKKRIKINRVNSKNEKEM